MLKINFEFIVTLDQKAIWKKIFLLIKQLRSFS